MNNNFLAERKIWYGDDEALIGALDHYLNNNYFICGIGPDLRAYSGIGLSLHGEMRHYGKGEFNVFYSNHYLLLSKEEFMNFYNEWIKGEYGGEVEVGESKPYDYINPSHYKQFSVEAIDMMVKIWGNEKVADHCEMCAFKYRMRMGTKPDQSIEQDIKKADWYLNKAKELRG